MAEGEDFTATAAEHVQGAVGASTATAMVMVVVFSVAVLAVGSARLRMAFVLTMVVGLAWELAQTTVAGHSARVADLAPNVVAGAASLLAAVADRRIASHVVTRNASRE